MIAVCLLASAGPGARAQDARLLLAVVLDGRSTGLVEPFIKRGAQLFTTVHALRRIGLQVPAALRTRPRDPLALSSLTHVSFRYDRPTQTLFIRRRREHESVTLLGPGVRPPPGRARSNTGVTLNYDVEAIRQPIGAAFAGQLGLRVFSPEGVVSSEWLDRYGSQVPDPPHVVRLNTAYTWSDPATLRRVRVGDFISQGPLWTRAVRLGGIGISSDFALRPDLVTFPLPSLTGSVTVPSTVDVLVNHSRLLSQSVPAGPFEIPRIPVVTGAGQIAMTVTNALGRRTTLLVPYYASGHLLAAGLQSYSLQAGWVRRRWSVMSDDYGPFAAYGTWRRGLTSRFTFAVHAEATSSVFMSGVGGAVALGDFGIGTASLAVSAGPRGGAAQYAIGISRRAHRVSFGLSLILAEPGFEDVAAANGAPMPREQLYATVGIALGRYGNLGLAYTALKTPAWANTPGQLPAGGIPPAPPLPDTVRASTAVSRVRMLSMNYAVNVHKLSFYAEGFREFGADGNSGMTIGVTISLGARRSVDAGGQWSLSRLVTRIQLMQNVSEVGQWGYHLYASRGPLSHRFAQVTYDAPWVEMSAGVDSLAGRSTERVAARGAVSWLDRTLLFSNYVNDAFALVDTNGVSGVTVYDENRRVGRTDSAGKLLVPDLRAFQLNHLAINPRDVPADVTVPLASKIVIPRDRSGVLIRFPLQPSRGALLKLVRPAGGPVPLGSVARLRSSGKRATVGYGGEVYFTGLRRHERVTVELPNHHSCRARFQYRLSGGSIPTIGPLTCRTVR